MKDKDIIQLKLSSGAEIVCEVMEWKTDESSEMIVRNAMSITTIDYDTGQRSYMFKPWISFYENALNYTIINPDHIVAHNRPGAYLLDQYYSSVVDMHENDARRDAEFEREKLEGLSRVAKALERVMKKKNNTDDEEEKLPDNILYFPRNDDEPPIH